METRVIQIISDIEELDELSLMEIKGGISSGTELCCFFNTRCNVNTQPEEEAKGK